MSAVRILFYCAALEPGRDGVGDYTRALAAACSRLGVESCLVALNDRHVVGQRPVTEDSGRIIRLPHALSWKSKTDALQPWLGAFKPTHTSWQIVSYGFSPKGILPRGLLDLARDYSPGIRHVMVHETWIGVHQGAKLKEQLVGWLQRRAMSRFLRTLGANRVDSSNVSYCQLLSMAGVPASELPLFGNIPVSSTAVLPPQSEAVLHAGPVVPLTVLIFGTIHPQWRPQPFAQWLKTLGTRLGRPVHILSTGRIGQHGASALGELRQEGIPLTDLGELPAEDISALMQSCTFGLALHPWQLIGKSGVAAAMIDHGMPVLVPRDDWALRGLALAGSQPMQSAEPLLLRMKDATPARTDQWLAARRPPLERLPEIADRFISALQKGQ